MLVPFIRFFYDADGSSGTPPVPETPQGDKRNDHPEPTPVYSIKPEYTNLPIPEAVSRTIQSIVTPKDQQIKELTEKNGKFETYLDSIARLQTDAEARIAFIRELEPSLIKPVNVHEVVGQRLVERYGKDFQFNKEDSTNNPMSQSALFEMDRNIFYQEEREKLKGGSNKTYSELLAEAKVRTETQQKKDKSALAELKVKYNVDDSVIQDFLATSKNFGMEDLFLHYINIKSSKSKTPNLVNARGSLSLTNDEKWEKATKLFGNPVNHR